MSEDVLQSFLAAREALVKEKETLVARLAEINRVLGAGLPAEQPPPETPSTRVRNTLSLKEAVVQATTGSPMTKEEILEAVQKLGYTFNTATPINSINVVLYGKKPKFRNEDGKFSPAK